MNSMLLHITPLLIDFDTTSVLMVGLTAVAFITTWFFNRISILRIRKRINESKEIYDVMQHTLDVNDNYVLRLDLRQRYAYNLHGDLLPKEGLSYEESFKFMHPEDHQLYRDFLVSLSKGNTKTAECIFRWDMSGDKHAGEWRYMHDQGVAEYIGGQKTPTNIFCTLTDQTERVMLEHEEQELTDKYQMTFEQSLVGLAFYDKDGHLLTVNQKMREILKFQSEHDPFYFENTLYDMPTFRDVLSNKYMEELYCCSKSVIIERGVNCYTEMRVHPIYDEKGEMVYITFLIRDVTQERELYLQSKQNGLKIRRTNEEIQNLENEIQYLMDSCDMRFWRTTFADKTVTFYKGLKTSMPPMGFDELREHFVQSTFKDDLLDPEN